jgi:conjugal transfer pilus assembly protein TraU
VKETSLWATRSLAALHRRGLARRTMGNDALCGAPIAPFMPKTQYKFSMFFPVPETTRGHAIGESTLRWGISKHGTERTIPAVGEDHLYILWRWNDCCAVFF